MGDDVCWLDRTCFACGRFVEDAADREDCPHCGEPLPPGADTDAG